MCFRVEIYDCLIKFVISTKTLQISVLHAEYDQGRADFSDVAAIFRLDTTLSDGINI